MLVTGSIKTLDLDLPSYGDLSDAKASVANVEGLAKESEVGMAKEKAKGLQLSSVLPSTGKSTKAAPKVKQVVVERKAEPVISTSGPATKPKEERQAQLAIPKAKEQPANGKSTKIAANTKIESTAKAQEAPSREKSVNTAPRAKEEPTSPKIKSAKLSKQESIFQKQEEERKLKEMKVVDLSLPSYSDSTVTKDKGVFSI